MRLVIDVEVQGGTASAAQHHLPRLRALIERLAPTQRPTLVRVDIVSPKAKVMVTMAALAQPTRF